jgi:shikimate dehydrogenase
VVVGAGGAARAVVLALAEAGAQEVVVVNRSADHAGDAAALAGGNGRVGTAADIAHGDLVVQATPVGMEGGAAEAALAFDPDLVHAGQVVVDLVYHPMVTPLLAAAHQRGAQTVGGLGMLVHQAALAVEQWTGRAAPVEAMWTAAERRSAQTGG